MAISLVKTITLKITGFLFILLGVTPLLFVLFITLKKEQVRLRMNQELKYQTLQTVIIPESEVIWMDKHEIWVNKSMFDIHSKKLENGIYTFTGLYDKDESLLVEMERNTAEKNKEQNRLLVQLFKSLPFFCRQLTEIQPAINKSGPYNSIIWQSPLNPFREIPTPPPQI